MMYDLFMSGGINLSILIALFIPMLMESE